MCVRACVRVHRELYFRKDQNFYRIFNAKIQSTIFLEVIAFSRRILATNRLALSYMEEIFFSGDLLPREVCFSVAMTICRRAISGLSMTKTCIWFDIAFFRHNTYVQYGTIQISNGISCDVHSLFTPDAEIMPGMLRVLSYPPSRRAGNAELSLFSWQKEHIPVKEENLSQIPLGNVYIYISLDYFGLALPPWNWSKKIFAEIFAD